MESAVADHLRCPRTQRPQRPEDYVPSYASWVARFSPSLKQLTIAYLGIQWRDEADADAAFATLSTIVAFLDDEVGPDHHDVTYCQDEAGARTYVVVAYWARPETFDQWRHASGAWDWFEDDARTEGSIGLFREVLSPRSTHFETIFSTPDKFEGASILAERISGEFREHGYWGGMRDRLPATQTDTLIPFGSLEATRTSGRAGRVTVAGHDNLAIIRSGQDWTATVGAERHTYVSKVQPVLDIGMAFLRDEGRSIGCYFNRSLTLLDDEGRPTEKTFSYSAWNDLASLERWASTHPTHLAIYGTFMDMVSSMDNNLRLRLYHEVIVVKAAEQFYEYINCHPQTGMLRAVG